MAHKCVSVPLGVCTHAQSPSRKNRGSALLLTVGLLAILAMLGSTFLLISRMNRKQCVAIASKIPVDPLASGIISQMKEELKRDLYLSDPGGAGPYDTTKIAADGATDPQKWQRFTDYPMKCDPASPTVMARDYWLTDISTASGGHVSNLYGTCTATYTLDDPPPATVPNADTNGDGTDDAKSEDSSVVNDIGGTYHVAVRVVDTSGLLCCNTACNATTLTTPVVCPVNVDLATFLGAVYSNVSTARGSDNIVNYNGNCALCLLNPASSAYNPFAIGDEMYLRWLKDGAQSETGRLFDATKTGETALAAATRKHMTTLSCTRSLVRYPDISLQVRLNLLDMTAPGNGLGNPAKQQILYNRLKVILGDSKKAANVVANVWAYADGMDQAKDYAFKPTSESFTAYGVKPQLVITEAFAKHEKNNAAPQDNSAYGYAIEVYNPTDAAISLTDYKIIHPDGTTKTTLSGNINAGAKKVFYDFGKGAQSTDTADSLFGVSVAGWTPCPSVDFSGGTSKVRLTRGGATEIPADEVSNTELAYSCASKTLITDADDVKDIRRDDSAKARCNVAMYKPSGSHVLGNANSTTFTTAECSEGFKINKPGTSGLANLGELLNVYMAGPIKEGTTPTALPQQLKANYATSAFLGRLNYASDSPVSASTDYPNTIACGTLLGEFFEAVPVDSVRDDSPPPPASRNYGKININTAPKEVLQQLPFVLKDHEGAPIALSSSRIGQIVQAIIDYRDKTGTYASRSGDKGFMTPGEIAIPMVDCVAVIRLTVTEKQAGYLEASNSIYESISNLISVNSDTFVANIKITMKGAGADRSWNYVVFIDRSNCWDSDDDPAVLLFSPAK
ncbi:MAG: hypothetical protein K8S55_12710 [Phycisphaerae bacterium]|nr:hypothetical protein [Phycisphaerae bacterium]